MDNSPCEYCGAALPFGVDKPTRRTRSHHFQNCSMRPQHKEVEQSRREWQGLTDADYDLICDNHSTLQGAVRAIEAKLKEKNA